MRKSIVSGIAVNPKSTEVTAAASVPSSAIDKSRGGGFLISSFSQRWQEPNIIAKGIKINATKMIYIS